MSGAARYIFGSFLIGLVIGVVGVHQRGFRVSEAYETRVAELEELAEQRGDSLEVLEIAAEVHRLAFEDRARDHERLKGELAAATRSADAAAEHADALSEAINNDTATEEDMRAMIVRLRGALVQRTVQCDKCNQEIANLERGIGELLARNATLARKVLLLEGEVRDLKERIRLANEELDRARGSWASPPMLIGGGLTLIGIIAAIT